LTAGYNISPGKKVLIGVNSMYDEAVVKAITQAIREVGAKVDIVSYDMGPDRELDYIDEFNGFIHNWRNIEEENPVRWWIERRRWVEKIAEDQGYDLLIHSLMGPVLPSKDDKDTQMPDTIAANYAYEGIPWITREILPVAKFPYELWNQINIKAMEKIWTKAPGGRGRLTDPEGTDISWTYWDEYFDLNRYHKSGSSARGFKKEPTFGHLYGRPTAPIIPEDDAEGVVSGTTNHIGRPFPNIKAYVEKNQIVRVAGGGIYGDLFRDLLHDTKGIKYPEYPDKGFLYWWELGIGTNPKMFRPFNSLLLSGAGTVYERLRSGVIHMGFGTHIYGPSEVFAAEKKLIYGHIHIHLLFANFEITTKRGEVVKIIDNGRLTILDDPEVVVLASKFGNPKELLREDWIPPIPGISVPGDYYKDYSRDPFVYIKKYHASTGKTSA